MKVIIAGSRPPKFPDSLDGLHAAAVWVDTATDAVSKAAAESGFEISEVVSGGARGIDQLGEAWAFTGNVPLRQFRPDWKGLGLRAGYERNKQMGDYADALIAVWDGQSRGTKQMIEYMKSLGKPVVVRLLEAA